MAIETHTWINPSNGETRHYINGWLEMLGVEFRYYDSGNIYYAAIDGEKISNNRARRIGGKLWADKQGNLHLDRFNGDIFYTEAKALERIRKYINENGDLDFLAAEDEEEPAGEEKFTGTLTTADIEIIEAAASGPMEEYDTPAEMASEAAQEIAQKYGVDRMEIYNAYLQAKGERPRQVFPLAWKYFAKQFES